MYISDKTRPFSLHLGVLALQLSDLFCEVNAFHLCINKLPKTRLYIHLKSEFVLQSRPDCQSLKTMLHSLVYKRILNVKITFNKQSKLNNLHHASIGSHVRTDLANANLQLLILISLIFISIAIEHESTSIQPDLFTRNNSKTRFLSFCLTFMSK